MCYNCGCLLPDDDMGSVDNITTATFDIIAKKKGIPRQEVMKELKDLIELDKEINDPIYKEMFDKACKAWGQPMHEARKNTLELLKSLVFIK